MLDQKKKAERRKAGEGEESERNQRNVTGSCDPRMKIDSDHLWSLSLDRVALSLLFSDILYSTVHFTGKPALVNCRVMKYR